MRFSMVRCLVGLAGIAAAGLLPLACSGGGSGSEGGGGSGGNGTGGSPPGQNKIGALCLPSGEMSFRFSGYRVTEDVIETGAPECGGGVCLVNHTQGRMSCPLGQAAPVDAQGLHGCTPDHDANGNFQQGQGSCADGDLCVEAGSYSPACDPSTGADADKVCAGAGAGQKCGSDGTCDCSTDADCAFVTGAVVACEPTTHKCMTYACHKPGECQNPSATNDQNAGKACCLPGTDMPVTEPVCGQCTGVNDNSTRDARSAVYCSCRCGVADGAPDEPDYPFCACPLGFECSEIRPYVGLGDPKNSGKYCIRKGTAYDANQDQCGLVDGHWDPACAGVASNQCQTPNGPCQ